MVLLLCTAGLWCSGANGLVWYGTSGGATSLPCPLTDGCYWEVQLASNPRVTETVTVSTSIPGVIETVTVSTSIPGVIETVTVGTSIPGVIELLSVSTNCWQQMINLVNVV